MSFIEKIILLALIVDRFIVYHGSLHETRKTVLQIRCNGI